MLMAVAAAALWPAVTVGSLLIYEKAKTRRSARYTEKRLRRYISDGSLDWLLEATPSNDRKEGAMSDRIDTEEVLNEIDQLIEKCRARARIIEARVSQEHIKPPLKWHRNDEDPPKAPGMYLITARYRYSQKEYVGQALYTLHDGWFHGNEVIAWAQLPEPYHEEEECD